MLKASLTIMLVAAAALALAEAPDGEVQRSSSTNFALDWCVLDAGGGGSTSSAGYAASLTVGQTVVGVTEDATRQAAFGFWYGVDLPLFTDDFESGDTLKWSNSVGVTP